MIRSFVFAGACFVIACYWSTPVMAATPQYQGLLLDGVTYTDSVSSSGTFNDPATARYWSFLGNQGDVVTITALRQEFDFDPGFWVYEGLITDTSVFDGGLLAGFDEVDPGFLAFADDQLPNPGPWGDPQASVLLTLPGTGAYTVAMVNVLSGPNHGGDGLFSYEITALNTVPEPACIGLLAMASFVLGGSRKNRR
jgi:hypothetical protein